MKISIFPIYKVIFGPKRELLIEKIKTINNSKKNLYTLLFFGKEKTIELLVGCELNHFQIGNNTITEYIPIRIDVINNQGETDGSEFIDWLSKFISFKDSRFDCNIYNENAKDMIIKTTSQSEFSISKFSIKKFLLCGCTVKNVVFYDKREKNKPQMTIDLNIKSGFIED